MTNVFGVMALAAATDAVSTSAAITRYSDLLISLSSQQLAADRELPDDGLLPFTAFILSTAKDLRIPLAAALHLQKINPSHQA